MDRAFKATGVLRTDETGNVAPSVEDAYDFTVAGPSKGAAVVQARVEAVAPEGDHVVGAPESPVEGEVAQEVTVAVEEAEEGSEEPTEASKKPVRRSSRTKKA